MSLLNYSEIPGYVAARNREDANRELAFFPMPPPILGVPVRHLNARHHMLLVGCRNRFLVGGMPTPEDVAMFLWFLSPEYSTQPGARELWVNKHVRSLDFRAAVLAIVEHLERVFQDCPPQSDKGPQQKAYTAGVAGTIDILAQEYGWSDEEILEMPLARIFQYFRRIASRKIDRFVMFNPSDRLIGEYLCRRMQPATNASETN